MSNQSQHEKWIKEWVKVRGVYVDITLICDGLQLGAKQCNDDSIAISLVTIGEGISNENLTGAFFHVYTNIQRDPYGNRT